MDNIEQSVLGGILIDNNTLFDIQEVIKPIDFPSESARLMYETMVDMFEKKQPIDSITLAEKLSGKVGIEVVSRLCEVSSAVHVVSHAQILRQQAIKRMINTLPDIMNEYDDPYEGLEEIEKMISVAGMDGVSDGTVSVGSVVDRIANHIKNIKSSKCAEDVIRSQFYDLDDVIYGFENGRLYILAARPAQGKSSLGMAFAENSNKPVLVFSLEMGAEQLVSRMLSARIGKNTRAIRAGDVTGQEYKHASDLIQPMHIHINDTPGLTVRQVRAISRRKKKELGIGMIVIDYLQLMSGSGKEGSREQEISTISRSLKGLAKELDVPVVALSQLNRGVEMRADKRPLLSDLRESGSLEQDADVVLFLYRDEMYGIPTDANGNPTEGVAEVIIGKQRDGPTGTVKLKFIKQFTRFENLTPDLPEAPPSYY